MSEESSMLDSFAAYAEKKTVVIKGVEFKFRKLLVMDALDVIEDIRVSIDGNAVGQAIGVGGAGSAGLLIAAIPRILSKDAFERIRKKLFRVTDFRILDTGDTPRPIVSDGLDEQPRAFERTGPLRIYEVAFRAAAVNFTEELLGLVRAIQEASQDSGLLSTQPSIH